MKYKPEDHTFVICAYKETPYLLDCICSLLKQSVKTNIIICTSTPNAFIKDLAEAYNIPLFVNSGASGLASDWNYAASCVQSKIYTLCHQDDYYFEKYAQKILEKANKKNDFIISYTKYMEDKEGVLEKKNTNLRIKNIMNFPLKFSVFTNSVWIRRRILSLGNPICCPAVTFNKEKVEKGIFDASYKNAADWDAWERLSRQKGAFLYCTDYLMAHRIHEESTTTLNIQDNTRAKEDIQMFERFWPKGISKLLAKIFGLSEKNNK